MSDVRVSISVSSGRHRSLQVEHSLAHSCGNTRLSLRLNFVKTLLHTLVAFKPRLSASIEASTTVLSQTLLAEERLLLISLLGAPAGNTSALPILPGHLVFRQFNIVTDLSARISLK